MLMKFCLKLRLGAFLLGILTTKFHHLGKNLTLWQVFGRSSSIWQNFVPALRILLRLGKVSFLRMDKYIMYDQSSHLVTLYLCTYQQVKLIVFYSAGLGAWLGNLD